MKENLLKVSHYGIHYASDGVAYLHQGGTSANFISLQRKSPYEVRPTGHRACPHLINVAAPRPDRVHWEIFMDIFHDPLVQEMLPIPKARGSQIAFLADEMDKLTLDLVTLSRMSSPIYPSVINIERMTERKVIDLLQVTNVSPLVLTNVKTEHQMLINKAAAESRVLPRRLVLVGDPHMVVASPMRRIETHLFNVDERMLAALPMETLGAFVLRRFARGEQLDGPLLPNRHG